MGYKKEIDWENVWRQMAEALEKCGAPLEVRKALESTEWEIYGDRFYFHCPKALYSWIEVPQSEGNESNLRYIKPVLWPIMQRVGCRTLIYKLL